MAMSERINIDQPRWDQNEYWGRARHFFTITNPMNLFVTGKELDKSKEIVTRYRYDDVILDTFRSLILMS